MLRERVTGGSCHQPRCVGDTVRVRAASWIEGLGWWQGCIIHFNPLAPAGGRRVKPTKVSLYAGLYVLLFFFFFPSRQPCEVGTVAIPII